MIKSRMIPRLKFVGSSPETKEQIEDSYKRQLRILNAHLEQRTYLFGDNLTVADAYLFVMLLWATNRMRSRPTVHVALKHEGLI